MLLASVARVMVAQSATPTCVRYGPDSVRLTGILERRVYPGAPNFTSVASGDSPESGYYLAMAEPICTYGGGGSRMNEPHKGVRRVQLVLENDNLDRAAADVGARVTMRGTLFSAVTGHHHTPIVMTVFSPVIVVQDGKRLAQIRAWSTATAHELPRYKTVKRDLWGFSAEGGELTAYFSSDTLRRIDADITGEMGRASEQYLFRDGAPYFVYWKVESYDRPLSGHVIRSSETRLYYDDDRLIRWIDSTGRRREVTGRAAEAHQQEASDMARILATCARSHSKSCEAASDSSSPN
jgi:hypothetical protein